MKSERLLQSQGFGSRKECRAMIRAGLLSVAGEPIEDPSAELDPAGLTFVVDGEVWQYREKAYLMLHKPADHECSHKPQYHSSVFALLPLPLVRRNVQCVGRLDHDTTGLLLLSDDGQFIHVWSSGKKRIPKTYEVTTRHPLTDAMLAALRDGVQLHDEAAPIRAFACEATGPCTLRLTVTEGKYHQVKRMIAAAGNRVEALHRSRIGGLALPDDLAPGQWRWLDHADLEQLADFERDVV
jgi:16S rRNA pseudouridine516 synthase